MSDPVVEGVFYDGTNSRGVPCSCYADDQGNICFNAGSGEIARYALDSLSIPSRIGNTPRLIRLPGGGYFETGHNDALDRMAGRFRKRHSLLNPHYWESRLKYMVASVVLLMAMMFGFIHFALPLASSRIAEALPQYISVELASGVLDRLDDSYFSASELDAQRKARLEALFHTHVPAESGFSFKLHFRKGGIIGANAFALPDGSIIITDELVKLTADDREILSVLLHEIGHVVHRHALRKSIEASGVAAAYAWLTGDLEGVSTLILAVPVVLVQAGYSRRHEWEADSYALEKMIENSIDPALFSRIMCRLGREKGENEANQEILSETEVCRKLLPPGQKETGTTASAGGDDKQPDKGAPENGVVKDLINFLSTHPASEKRVLRFLEFQKT